MSEWSPDLYLRYGDLRTRPARDLAQALAPAKARRIVDLGCGPGNSTAICRHRWPEASVVGIDRSEAMIAKARESYADGDWRVANIDEWALGGDGERYDVIFSNAALHWVDDHAALFPQLLKRLDSGGVLGVQMPAYEMAPNRLMREIADEMGVQAEEWLSHPLAFYYETLQPLAARLDLWATEYVHLMADSKAIVEWYSSTGLRPYLDALTIEQDRTRFLAEFIRRLREIYPASPAGGVLFPFRRIFIAAYAA